mmetsp:Transcript_74106/g.123799  ORF Transcript_74106/g.123799 Transcript_74106/m.123799 type:complete len:199 (-) Transcript_74106:229-825(-)
MVDHTRIRGFCAAFCFFAPEIVNDVSQQGATAVALEWWLVAGHWIFSFQAIWGLAFLAVNAGARRSIIGSVLNLPYTAFALLGLYGTSKRSLVFVATSLLFSLGTVWLFVLFTFLNYLGSRGNGRGWVVFAIYLPGLVVDILLIALNVPLVYYLHQMRQPASGDTQGDPSNNEPLSQREIMRQAHLRLGSQHRDETLL